MQECARQWTDREGKTETERERRRQRQRWRGGEGETETEGGRQRGRGRDRGSGEGETDRGRDREREEQGGHRQGRGRRDASLPAVRCTCYFSPALCFQQPPRAYWRPATLRLTRLSVESEHQPPGACCPAAQREGATRSPQRPGQAPCLGLQPCACLSGLWGARALDGIELPGRGGLGGGARERGSPAPAAGAQPPPASSRLAPSGGGTMRTLPPPADGTEPWAGDTPHVWGCRTPGWGPQPGKLEPGCLSLRGLGAWHWGLLSPPREASRPLPPGLPFRSQQPEGRGSCRSIRNSFGCRALQP